MEKQNSNKNTNKTYIQIQFERNGHTMFFTGGSREFEILRKDTIAGKCAFSLLSVYSCNFSLFRFIVCFFHAKVRCRVMSGWGIMGHQWAPMQIKVNTGKWRRKRKRANSI